MNYNLDPDSKQGLSKPYYEEYIKRAEASSSPASYQDGIVEGNKYLGYYYLQQGKKDEAATYYEKVLALDPANTDATNAMNIIKPKAQVRNNAPKKK